MTFDQGKEMARHVGLTANTGVKVYFCDPNSPWQRRSCKNTSGLFRQYQPKGTDSPCTASSSQMHCASAQQPPTRRPRLLPVGRRPPGHVGQDQSILLLNSITRVALMCLTLPFQKVTEIESGALVF